MRYSSLNLRPSWNGGRRALLAGAVLAALILGAAATRPAVAAGLQPPPVGLPVAQTAPVPPQPAGTFTPSPVYGSLGLALVVYSGGTIDDLQGLASTVGASGVWVQDRTGVYQLLVVNGPAFVTGGFAAQFPSASAGAPNFTGAIAVTLVQARPASSRTVTLADNGATLTMRVGDRFVLSLGETYNWNVQVADQNVVSRVVNITVVRGSQGVYEGRGVGETDLTASGDPGCATATPRCLIPSLLFRVHLIVTP
jgi:hypothetical protein